MLMHEAFAQRYASDPADPAVAQDLATYSAGWSDCAATDHEIQLPQVEPSIQQLIEALIHSKGWMRSYAAAIVRDAIDRADPLTNDERALLKDMRRLGRDHSPAGWPAVKMRDVSMLCDVIERLAGAVRDNEVLR